MSSGPAHPGVLVGVDGFAVIRGCCAVGRARGNGAQYSAHDAPTPSSQFTHQMPRDAHSCVGASSSADWCKLAQ